MLRSLTDIIEEFHPHVISEVFKHTDLAYRTELLAFFRELGYTVYRAGRDGTLKETELTAETLTEWKHYDVFAVPVS